MGSRPVFQGGPKCPKCGATGCVLSQNALRGDERKPDEVACLWCGEQWPGTDEERAQAARADRAWHRQQMREERTEERDRRHRELEEKLARLREGHW